MTQTPAQPHPPETDARQEPCSRTSCRAYTAKELHDLAISRLCALMKRNPAACGECDIVKAEMLICAMRAERDKVDQRRFWEERANRGSYRAGLTDSEEHG